jgi:hypothetical protein
MFSLDTTFLKAEEANDIIFAQVCQVCIQTGARCVNEDVARATTAGEKKPDRNRHDIEPIGRRLHSDSWEKKKKSKENRASVEYVSVSFR